VPARIVEREINEDILASTQQLDLHPVAQRVLAGRASKYGTDPATVIDCGLRDLDSPATLPDIDVAAARIAQAISDGEVIGLETDHDVDGVTSHAVLYRALHDFFGHPREKIRSYIGHRLKEGYGLSDALCDRILADEIRPTLIITADNGSSDAPRIQRLRALGVDTVVSDHHGMPEEGPPADAVACVSPARPDSAFPDPLIAGVMVSFLLMCAVRQRLMEQKLLAPDAQRLTSLLDYVALGTVADCVSLVRSRNNRAVIRAGLTPINQGARPCWRAIRPFLGDPAKPVTSQDLAFSIGPRINAVGRLDDAMVGVKFLLSETDQEAARWVEELNRGNVLRREIESDLKDEAMLVGELQVESGRTIIQVCLTEGHAGVHGIVASRLVEAFGRPAVCFSAKLGEPGVLTGSARGVEGMHIRDAMQRVEELQPGLLMKFGGHEGAGGLTLKEADFPEFERLFEQIVSEQVGERTLEPLIITDGIIETNQISEGMIDGFQALEPFGREFEAPLLVGRFKMMSGKPMGQTGVHWRFKLIGVEGGIFEAVWFNAGETCPLSMSGFYRVAFTPDLNWWNGRAKMQLMIRAAEPAHDVQDTSYAI
jgi:single-stranded-DNA-specific exonuclease